MFDLCAIGIYIKSTVIACNYIVTAIVIDYNCDSHASKRRYVKFAPIGPAMTACSCVAHFLFLSS